MTILYGLIIVLIVSTCWFWHCLGRKHEPDRWYDRVMLAPMLCFLWLFFLPRDIRDFYRKHWPYQSPRTIRGRCSASVWENTPDEYDDVDEAEPVHVLIIDYERYVTYQVVRNWEYGWLIEFEVYWNTVIIDGKKKRAKHARNITEAK